jgi:glutathione S-transferase
MLVLYNAPHSTCSQKVRLCLAEKKLPFREIKLDLGAGKDHLKPDYLKLNPNGVVPTLVDDGTPIVDSSVICEYLDERYPDGRLTPDDLVERARMRALMRYLEEVPTSAVRVPSFNMAFLPRFAGLDHDDFLREQADIRPLRKHFYRRMGPAGFKREDVEASLEQLGNTWARMDTALADGPWLPGINYSLADIVMAPLIARMADLGFARAWEDQHPRVTDWYARMRARPAYNEAFYPGSRLSEFMPLSAAIRAVQWSDSFRRFPNRPRQF